jgi:ABC-2 type transport system permease protein
MLSLVVLSTAVIVGAPSDQEALTENWADTLAGNAGLAPLFAVIFGILLMSGEYRHGTVTWTFLATPRRERVLTAKLVVAAFAGIVLAVLAAAVTSAVAVPWLQARDLHIAAGEYLGDLGGLLVGSAFWGALGVAVGTLLRNQVVAVIVALVWFLVVENLVVALLPDIGRWLPDAALQAMLGGSDLDDPLPRLLGGAVALGYVLGIAAAGYAVTLRRDVT